MYNNSISIFNEVINRITWFITVRKWRDNFRNKFKITEQNILYIVNIKKYNSKYKLIS